MLYAAITLSHSDDVVSAQQRRSEPRSVHAYILPHISHLSAVSKRWSLGLASVIGSLYIP
jgi:hypothetical protein